VSLGENIAQTEMALQDARLDEIDAEAAVDFAVALALKADRMWVLGSLAQRQQLQQALFPEGLVCRENRLVRTPTDPLFFREIALFEEGHSRLVSPTGLEPVLPP
jgi:hypothetical protein